MAIQNLQEILDLFPALADKLSAVNQDELQTVLDTAIDIIRHRTQSGLDVDNDAFTPYSPKYAAQRLKLGLSTTPNLTRSGDMLDSMTGVVIDQDIEIYAELPAPFHDEGTSRIPQRHFLGLNEGDTESLESLIIDLMAHDLT